MSELFLKSQDNTEFEVYSASSKNHGGSKNPYNQDFLTSYISPRVQIFAVCDGHGKEKTLDSGGKIAETCTKYLPIFSELHEQLIFDNIESFIDLWSVYIEEKILEEVQKFILDNNITKPFTKFNGGSTSSIIIITDTFIHRAYLGDSKILGCCNKEIDTDKLSNKVVDLATGFNSDTTISNNTTKWVLKDSKIEKETLENNNKPFFELSSAINHDALNIYEYKRCLEYCKQTNKSFTFDYAHPRRLTNQQIFTLDLDNNEIIEESPQPGKFYYCTSNKDIATVIKKNEYGNLFELAMTRSHGEYNLKDVGVSSEYVLESTPIKSIFESNDQDLFCIIGASDGIWDCLTNEQVQEFIMRPEFSYQEPETIVERLIEYILEYGKTLFGEDLDNLSAWIIFLKKI